MATTDELVARLAVQLKYVTQERIDECVRELGTGAHAGGLGPLLVKKR